MMSAYGRSHSSVDKKHNGDAVGLIGVPDARFSLSNTTPAARRAQQRTRGETRTLKVTALQRRLQLARVPSRRRLIRDSTCGLSESGPTPAPSPRLASYLDQLSALPTIIFIAICLFSKTWVWSNLTARRISKRHPLISSTTHCPAGISALSLRPALARNANSSARDAISGAVGYQPGNAITRIRALGTIRTPRIRGLICRNCLSQDECTSSGDEHALSRDGLCLCSDQHLSLISLQ